MKTSIEALRHALKVAPTAQEAFAVDIVVMYINKNNPYPAALTALLRPTDDDPAFNRRLDLVKAKCAL